MRVAPTRSLNPLLRWRWDAVGQFGYAVTKRGAATAARRAIETHERRTDARKD